MKDKKSHKVRNAILGVVALLAGWVGTSLALAYRENKREGN